MALDGFLPVSRVTSTFRAAATAGNRFNLLWTSPFQGDASLELICVQRTPLRGSGSSGQQSVGPGGLQRVTASTFCGPRAFSATHVLSLLVSKEPLCEGPVPAVNDPSVPVGVNPNVPDLNRVLCQQLAHRTYELSSSVNLKELRPPQGAPLMRVGRKTRRN